jgi:polyvinyl alcohol dehydrogenase (cytochrome)
VSRRFLLAFGTALALAVPLLPVASAGAEGPAWTTYRHDAARSGIDPDSTSPLPPSQAWQTPPLDGQVYGQPLVYGPNVYVVTENDTIYALDAASGAVVWSSHLATPEPSFLAPCGDISPSIGITSTPVIDPSTNRIYAVGAVSAADGVHHELFALDTGSGQPVAGFPIAVDPGGATPVNQLQRPGLALDSGRVLIGYGGNSGDCATYWGWLVSAPTDTTSGLSFFQADADYGAGAIWASGNAPPVDATGNVFMATGNGIGNSSSDPEYGDSVVKLNAFASPLDWWAPPNWQSLDDADADLGSSMPTLLPGGFVFQSGKDHNGYLLDGATLGGVSSPAAELPGFCPGGSFGGSVYDPANSTIYAACNAGMRALSLGSGSPPSLAAKAGFSAPGGAIGPPTIAGGLVWAVNSGSGTLYGLDPESGATSSQFAVPKSGSQVNHFASPSAGGGRLFVGSGDQVTAFLIAQPSPPGPTTTTAGTGSAGGSGTGGAGGSGTSSASASVPPSISGASISPRRFRAKRAATLRLTVNEPARVFVAVTQLHHGHLVRHRCRTQARRGKSCQVRLTFRSLQFEAHAGGNAFQLHLRRLVAGQYTALVYATNSSGQRSRTVGIRFAILAPQPPAIRKSTLRGAGAGLTGFLQELAP